MHLRKELLKAKKSAKKNIKKVLTKQSKNVILISRDAKKQHGNDL